MAKLVSTVYADALFDIVSENMQVDGSRQLDENYADIILLIQLLKENSEFLKILNSPNIGREEKQTLLKEAFEKNLSKEVLGFLKIVVEKNRQEHLLDILYAFVEKYKELKKIGIVYIQSAVELSEMQKQEIYQKLLSTTKYHSLEIHYHVDKSIIGGLIIRIKNRVMDSSVRTKIYNIKKQLLNCQITGEY